MLDTIGELVKLWEGNPGAIGVVELFCEFCYNTPKEYVVIGGNVYFLCQSCHKEFIEQLAGRTIE